MRWNHGGHGSLSSQPVEQQRGDAVGEVGDDAGLAVRVAEKLGPVRLERVAEM